MEPPSLAFGEICLSQFVTKFTIKQHIIAIIDMAFCRIFPA